MHQLLTFLAIIDISSKTCLSVTNSDYRSMETGKLPAQTSVFK